MSARLCSLMNVFVSSLAAVAERASMHIYYSRMTGWMNDSCIVSSAELNGPHRSVTGAVNVGQMTAAVNETA